MNKVLSRFSKQDFIIIGFIAYFLIGFIIIFISPDDQANIHLRQLTQDLPKSFFPWVGHLLFRYLLMPLFWPMSLQYFFS